MVEARVRQPGAAHAVHARVRDCRHQHIRLARDHAGDCRRPLVVSAGFVTLDYGCQYMRALYTSNIDSGTSSLQRGPCRTSLAGRTDLPTKFYVFTSDNDQIVQSAVNVPVFSGSAQVSFTVRVACCRRSASG